MYYSLIAFNGADKIKVKDILPFPWDESKTELSDIKPATKAELEAFWKERDNKSKTN